MYASGGPGARLPELETDEAITRYGVRPVLSRDWLTAREIRDMRIARRIVEAYFSRQAAIDTEGGLTEWAENNPALNDLLNAAMMEATEGKHGG